MKTINEYIDEAIIKGKLISYDKKPDPEKIKEIEEYVNSSFYKIEKPNITSERIKYTFGLDTIGYYISTEADTVHVGSSGDLDIKTIDDIFNKSIDDYKLHRDKECPKFRWKSHTGRQIVISDDLQSLESLVGLPKDINILLIGDMCGAHTGKIDLGNLNIKKLRLYNVGNIQLTGNPKIDEIEWLGWNGKKPRITFNCKNMHKG